jgi:hypothetical protein
MGSSASILWGVVFGSIGVGYIVYGKKQKRLVPLLSGIGLCGFTYIAPNPYLIVLIGIFLAALPFLMKDRL